MSEFTRSSSAEAYEEIKANGMLGQYEMLILSYLPTLEEQSTANEVWRAIIVDHPSIPQNAISPRFAPMRRVGVLERLPKRKCKFTGKKVYTYLVTNNVPDLSKFKVVTKKDKLIQRLRDQLTLIAEATAPDTLGEHANAHWFAADALTWKE